MVNIIGDLTTGAGNEVAIGTHTVYTVPSGKAAKVKLMFRALLANTGTILLTVNGVVVAEPVAASAADHHYSTDQQLMVDGATTAPTGLTRDTTVAPCPQEYFLSAGDTVTFTVGVANLTSMNIQVVGTEIDVV